MRFLYSSGVLLYVLAIRLSAVIGNRKAKLWIKGRKNILKNYNSLFQNEKAKSFIWFHVSSLGEFEQGRPLMEKIKQTYPEKKLLLTFFSPSGFELRKNYEYADVVMYLPPDYLKTMQKLVTLIKPCFIVFVKYDFWFNLIKACRDSSVPVYFVSSAFRPQQYFFKWWSTWFRNQLKTVSMFFVQTQESVELLKSHKIDNVTFAGDTRLDRVIEIKNEKTEFPQIETFANGRTVIIAGSSWPADEQILLHFANQHKDIALIIAPHDVSEERISHIEHLFNNKTVRLSSLSTPNKNNPQVLIIDNIGVLSKIYRYCHFAYIGNGFGKGIHNILECVVYGKPVVFGPNYRSFTEATELIKHKGAFSISNTSEFQNIAETLIYNTQIYQRASEACLHYVEQNKGASSIIINYFSTQQIDSV